LVDHLEVYLYFFAVLVVGEEGVDKIVGVDWLGMLLVWIYAVCGGVLDLAHPFGNVV
jgi:hypothetical protein